MSEKDGTVDSIYPSIQLWADLLFISFFDLRFSFISCTEKEKEEFYEGIKDEYPSVYALRQHLEGKVRNKDIERILNSKVESK